MKQSKDANWVGAKHSGSCRGAKPGLHKIKREFDPGSESTLAARLTHASRTRKPGQPGKYSGVRVSNTWVIHPLVGNNPGKPGLIPHKPEKGKQAIALREESAAD